MPRLLPLAAALVVMAASACDDPFPVCDAPPPDVLAAAPRRLSETGVDGPDVVPFAPRFQLWSDGADKQRWIRVPPGAAIDRSDPDDWRFPLGTRLWKQFAIDGVPVETRMLEKVGPADDDWLMVAYAWDDDGADATIAPDGVRDARGTTHDVPSATACRACHDGRGSRVLGYSAIQLADDVIVPGSELERAALGYLHANCGHCHNADRPPRRGARCYDPQHDLDVHLVVARLSRVEDTPTYTTAVGDVIRPGHPDDSRLLELVGRRGPPLQMPPLATDIVDESGVALLRRWIEEL